MNKKSAQTHQKVEAALFELMQAKKYTDISITELADHAEVSRMAFYRNYKTIDDVLNHFIQSEYDQFIADIAEHHLNELAQFLNIYFNYFKTNTNILKAVNNANIAGTVLKKQTEYFAKFLKSGLFKFNNINNYDLAYYSGATFSVLLYWHDNNYQNPIEEVIEPLTSRIDAALYIQK